MVCTFVRHLRAALKLGAYGLLCIISIPPQAVVVLFTSGKGAYFLPKIFHIISSRLFGIRVKIKGTPHISSQTLFICNHLSYLDIPAIGSVLSGAFVAKNEVAGWPVFGILAKLQKTLFISRSARQAAQERAAFEKRLSEGQSMILFPEGTSTDGRQIAPFKSSLFAAFADNKNLEIMTQAMTINILSINGKSAADQNIRDQYAWYGDMELPPHLWAFAGMSGCEVELVFHDAQPIDHSLDRKSMARKFEEQVRAGLAP